MAYMHLKVGEGMADRVERVLLNKENAGMVVECRVGTDGWVRRYCTGPDGTILFEEGALRKVREETLYGHVEIIWKPGTHMEDSCGGR